MKLRFPEQSAALTTTKALKRPESLASNGNACDIGTGGLPFSLEPQLTAIAARAKYVTADRARLCVLRWSSIALTVSPVGAAAAPRAWGIRLFSSAPQQH